MRADRGRNGLCEYAVGYSVICMLDECCVLEVLLIYSSSVLKLLTTMKLCIVSYRQVSNVTLFRDEKHSFGFSIRGTAENGGRFAIKNIKARSSAERSHSIAEGDVILSINGLDTCSMSRKDIRRLIKEADSSIELKLEYEIREACISNTVVYQPQRMMLKLKKENGSYGFTLRENFSRRSMAMEYPITSNINRGGPAYKEGSMRDGDRLLLVNGANISWLSLIEVAKILNEKEEAMLLIEYNVGNVNLPKQPAGEVELEIEALYSKLGIGLASSVMKPSKIYLDQIQRGSIAERCGAFHVGDIILAVNGIDIATLTETKVNALIQRLRKHPGKILYFPVEESSRQRDENIPSDKSINITSDACENLNAEENILHPSRCSSVCSNTSVGQNTADQRKNTSFLSLLHDVVERMKAIKFSLSQLAIKTANDRKIANKSQESSIESELCLHLENELLNLNSLFALTFQHFQDIALQLVTNSSCCNNDFSFKTDLIKHRCLRHEVINTLKGNLADILENKAISKHSFDIQMRGLSEVDLSCHKCSDKVLIIFADVQKILLLLSLKDESSHIWELINVLVRSLNEHKLPCEVCSNPQYSSVSDSEGNGSTECDYHNATFHPRRLDSENPRRQSSSRGKEFNALVQEISPEVQRMPSVDINLKDKIAHFHLSKLHKESNTLSTYLEETNDNMFAFEPTKLGLASHNSPTEKLTVQNYEPSHPYEDGSHINANSKNYAIEQEEKLQKDKGFVALPEPNIELTHTDLPLKTKLPANKFLSRCNTSTISKIDSVRNSSDIKSNPQVPASQGSSPSKPILTKENWRSNDTVPFEVSTREIKRHSEVLDVKLINRGEGFGFTIGYTKSRYVPVIIAVKEKSPVHRAGVILQNDRVLKINNRNIMGIREDELNSLQKELEVASEILLSIEFDVEEPEVKFGTFRVDLQKVAKIGIYFKATKRGSPMVVSGVTKGSAAHRSGAIFPGDEILYFHFVKTENYDPCTCDYSRKDILYLTVCRSPIDTITDILQSESKAQRNSQDSEEEFFVNTDSFIVRKSSIRAVDRNGAFILDTEVALFRDAKYGDFGIQIGHDMRFGRVYVRDIRHCGPAYSCRVIQKFDRIVKVNGVRVDKNSALEMFKQAGNSVHLSLRRRLHTAPNE